MLSKIWHLLIRFVGAMGSCNMKVFLYIVVCTLTTLFIDLFVAIPILFFYVDKNFAFLCFVIIGLVPYYAIALGKLCSLEYGDDTL